MFPAFFPLSQTAFRLKEGREYTNPILFVKQKNKNISPTQFEINSMVRKN